MLIGLVLRVYWSYQVIHIPSYPYDQFYLIWYVWYVHEKYMTELFMFFHNKLVIYLFDVI